MYQRRTVARGGEVGPADPMGSAKPGPPPVQVHFGGKITLILLEAADEVSIFILAGTDLKEL